MVGMWMLVMAVWKALARVLRHLGRGALLPLIAAMGVALFGVQPWTVAPVVLALIVAVWWPAIAADVLPVTMLVTGIWALMAAAVAPGARVGWAMARRSITFLAPPPALHAPVHIYGPGRVAPAGGPWQVLFPARFAISRAGVVEQAGAKGALGAFTVKPWPGPGRLPPRPFPGGPHPVAGHGGGLLPAGLLVPLALLLLALGLWLTPRALARLRDRMPWLVPYLRRWALENRWGVLLVPVAVFGLVVFGVHPWTVAAVVVAVVAAVRWPKAAADLVPVALVGLAGYGFAIAS